jgi:hypothetical protein
MTKQLESESQYSQDFSFFHRVQTDWGEMGTSALSMDVKQQWHEADHSPPTSAEDKKIWIYTSTLLYVFMA